MSLTITISGSIPPPISKSSKFENAPMDQCGFILNGRMSPRTDGINPKRTGALLTIIISSSAYG